jgi:hypothetical protein
MPLKNLDKVNGMVAPKAFAILPRIHPISTLKKMKNNWEKPLVESSRSNKSRRCSNTMPKNPLAKR